MKKLLFTIIGALLLVGCSHQSSAPAAVSINTYNNDDYNISFQYPANWEVTDSQIVKKLADNKVESEVEKFEHSVVLMTGDNQRIFFDYDSQSFDEYESSKQPNITEEFVLANYPGKKYTEYGIELAGISYMVEKNGKFLMFSTESDLTEEQRVGVEGILYSFE